MAEKSNASLGFEKQIWDATCVLWGHIPATDYSKVSDKASNRRKQRIIDLMDCEVFVSEFAEYGSVVNEIKDYDIDEEHFAKI